jgi:hypothetical protein
MFIWSATRLGCMGTDCCCWGRTPRYTVNRKRDITEELKKPPRASCSRCVGRRLQATQGDEPATRLISRDRICPLEASSHRFPASSYPSAPERALARVVRRDLGRVDQRALETPRRARRVASAQRGGGIGGGREGHELPHLPAGLKRSGTRGAIRRGSTRFPRSRAIRRAPDRIAEK